MPSNETSAHITLRTFVLARWVLLGLIALGWTLQATYPATFERIISWFPPPPEPRGTAAVMVILALLNLFTMRWILARNKATLNIAGIHLLIDATALTALLALSGGLANSFTAMYFIPITLSTQISPRWTWAVGAYCLLGFACLFVLTPEPEVPLGYKDYLLAQTRGIWVAFAISGTFMTYFVHRIAISLTRQRNELARLRHETQQDRHLAALGTLAAGAAHELGSPLGTIQMLVSDLVYMDKEEQREAAHIIKQEVARCKHILQQMSSPELRVHHLGKNAEVWPLHLLKEDLQGYLDENLLRVVVSEHVKSQGITTTQPRDILGQILRGLVANGIEACRLLPDSRGVDVYIDSDKNVALIEVKDDGIGMDEKVMEAAFDPFFSTKEEGKGMGLGLYLARAYLRQLGGTIKLTSEPKKGTLVTVRFPLQTTLKEN